MKVGDAIYFNDKKRLIDLKNATDDQWLDEWKKRIYDYYLLPSSSLVEKEMGFASLVLICSAIEAIGTIMSTSTQVGQRFKETIKVLLTSNSDLVSDSDVLYTHYRCGLVHNGRTNQTRLHGINKESEFSYIDFDGCISYRKDIDGYAAVNPKLLLNELIEGFNLHTEKNKTILGSRISTEFKKDVEKVKHL